MDITRLSCCLDRDYPQIDWRRLASMADLWLEVDERLKSDRRADDLLARIAYECKLPRRWPRIDIIRMTPGVAISARAREAFESLGVPGMRFLEFRVNGEPFFQFFTERRIDCLDLGRSEIEYFDHAPERVREVRRYAFLDSCLMDRDVFTLPELSRGAFFWAQQTFFTGPARLAVEGRGLVGLRFEELPVVGSPGPAEPAGPARAYGNAYFGLRFDIPETWELVSWKDSKIDRSWRPLYQARDDELPQNVGASKFLFTASRYAPGSQALVDASIEMSVQRLSAEADLRDSLLSSIALGGRTPGGQGKCEAGGLEFDYVDEVMVSGGRTAYFRFAFRRLEPSLWLYAKIAGYTPEHFQEAVRVFEGVTAA